MSVAYLPLEDVIHNRRWEYRKTPFPHVYADNVFKLEMYSRLEDAFSAILDLGLSDKDEPGRFSRRRMDYSAYNLSLSPQDESALALFSSRAWHDLLGRLFGIELTGEIDISLHHNPAGSQPGWIHNDFSPGWFIDNPNRDGIHHSGAIPGLYKSGRGAPAGIEPRQTVRAVAMVFYLCNPRWTAADGGGTGLYRHGSAPVANPAATIPPWDNSVVLFECTPFSHHTFLGTGKRPRNSIVMWGHRPFEAAVARWGRERIAWWK